MTLASGDFHPIVILGAGICGLSAASELRSRGWNPVVLDKGRSVGGRMSTRRIGPATFDHGAQFITSRDSRFGAQLAAWNQQGIAVEWCRGFGHLQDGHPRWRGMTGMNLIPKHISKGIEVRLEVEVKSVEAGGETWKLQLAGGAMIECGHLLLTCPVPQSLQLLSAGDVVLSSDVLHSLEAIRYERCLAVLAQPSGPSRIPAPGAISFQDGPIAWMADNQRKGISEVPSVTIHASDAFSVSHWEGDRMAAGRELLQQAAQWIDMNPGEFQVHGWRYSKPITVCPEPCLVASHRPGLVFAGDAFAGPRVEGSAVSGWAAAEAILTMQR